MPCRVQSEQGSPPRRNAEEPLERRVAPLLGELGAIPRAQRCALGGVVNRWSTKERIADGLTVALQLVQRHAKRVSRLDAERPQV